MSEVSRKRSHDIALSPACLTECPDILELIVKQMDQSTRSQFAQTCHLGAFTVRSINKLEHKQIFVKVASLALQAFNGNYWIELIKLKDFLIQSTRYLQSSNSNFSRQLVLITARLKYPQFNICIEENRLYYERKSDLIEECIRPRALYYALQRFLPENYLKQIAKPQNAPQLRDYALFTQLLPTLETLSFLSTHGQLSTLINPIRTGELYPSHYTFFILAMRRQIPEICGALLESGFDPNMCIIDEKTSLSILHRFFKLPTFQPIHIEKYLQIVELLLIHHVDVNLKCSDSIQIYPGIFRSPLIREFSPLEAFILYLDTVTTTPISEDNKLPLLLRTIYLFVLHRQKDLLHLNALLDTRFQGKTIRVHAQNHPEIPLYTLLESRHCTKPS